MKASRSSSYITAKRILTLSGPSANPARYGAPNWAEELCIEFVEKSNAPMFKFTRFLGRSSKTALHRVKLEELSDVHLCPSSICLCKSCI